MFGHSIVLIQKINGKDNLNFWQTKFLIPIL